jgi:hypothetical protein
MLFYTHMLRMRDILHPTFLTLAQAGLIYNLETSWQFYAFTALFFLAASCAICSCWAYTDLGSLGDGEAAQTQLARRFRGHFLVCLVISALGFIFSCALCEINYYYNSDAIVVISASAFVVILFVYRIQERRFVKSVYEIVGASPGQYKFAAGLRQLLGDDAWRDAAAALKDALDSCKLKIKAWSMALRPNPRP